LKLFLISRPSIDLESIHSFLDSEDVTWNIGKDELTAESLVEMAGRICYMSFGKKQSTQTGIFIKNIIDKGHDSVLEHANWSFIVSGITRSFSHQLVRHRIGFSYSQLSQQYAEHRSADYIAPQLLSTVPEAKKAWDNILEQIDAVYNSLINTLESDQFKGNMELKKKELKRAIRSVARSILPNAAATKIVFTANARSLRHLLKTRGAIEGDYEMREFALKLYNILVKEAPAIFSDFGPELLADGSTIVIQKTNRSVIL
jgi:thymidylate synthase (FAD)